MEPTSFTVKHEQFEGPIEVLLDLIERRKVFVNDVPLASVTDDFINYIQTHGMHPDTVAHFLSTAATLILIKARSLLPNIELTPEETDAVSDLERRVALYKIVRDISADLIRLYGKKISFEGIARNTVAVFAPDPTLTLEQLPELIVGVSVRAPKPQPKKPEARVYKTISISEVLTTLTERIERAMQTLSFNDIRVQSPESDERSVRVYTIVSFLGMLELVRRGIIDARQDELFTDITLDKQATNH